MILLKPLTHDFRNDDITELVSQSDRDHGHNGVDNNHRFVHHGHPMAQQDGYLVSNWMSLDMPTITGDNHTAAAHVKQHDGPIHWNAGPPYLFTALDGYKIATHWVDFAPRVFQQFPKLFAEMFGYIIASAHLNLPHTLIKSLVVSTTVAHNREGWSFVDAMPNVCSNINPIDNTNGNGNSNGNGGLFALHYCKRYILGKRWFWSKYRLRKDFMDCHVPLLQEPDSSIESERDAYGPPPVHSYKGTWTQSHTTLSAKQAKREAFMLCEMISKVNEAVAYYKRQACGNAGNYSKVYNVHDDPG
jgi:hypothetical protein